MQFFDMGEMPLANGFLTSPDADEPRYPLRLNLCQRCGMVQLSHVVPAGEMFNPGYAFHTGSSDRMLEHFKLLFTENVAKFMRHGDTLVEIGCNDALALCSFPASIHKVGIDPAANPNMDGLSGHHLTIITKPFTESLATSLDFKAKLIVACNVLGHVDDLDDFLRGVKALLHPEGAFVVEVPYLHRTIGSRQYDQLYHEHLSYFCVRSMDDLMSRNGLRIVTTEPFDVHGGSIRCTIRHGGRLGLYADQPTLGELRFFADGAESARFNLLKKLWKLQRNSKRIIAYGASAKGSVVLNYCGIGTDLVPLVADTTPAKQGRFMPGMHQPVIAPEQVNWSAVDAVLLLAWNHRSECEINLKNAGFTGDIILPHA
jgi:methylation protein EvaC